MRKQIVACVLAVSIIGSTTVYANTVTNPEVQGTLDTDLKLGDVNNNGEVEENDVTRALEALTGIVKEQPAHVRSGDLTKDGELSARDVLMLYQDITEQADYGLGYEKQLSDVEYYVPEGFETAEDGIGFLGADGFGKYTTGGRGGRIIEVTNLNDSGPGSLRAAIEETGKRIIVFKVSGTIYLKSSLIIKNGDVTIAGQTAPGDGICLTNNGFGVIGSNVIVRYLRVRTGDHAADSRDAVGITMAKNVILDHVTATWGTDETLSVCPGGTGEKYSSVSDNISVQWCIIAESITTSVNIGGKRHGMGSLIRGAQGSKITYHHNFYASHSSRMPMIGNYMENALDNGNNNVEFINNVVYNWSGVSSGKSSDSDENGEKIYSTNLNYINNYFKQGPLSSGANMFSEGSIGNHMYAEGNMMNGEYPASQSDLVLLNPEVLATDSNPYYLKSGLVLNPENYFLKERFANSTMTNIQPAEDVAKDVVSYAGASLARDTVDEAIINTYYNGTGYLINYVHESPGWSGRIPSTHLNPVYCEEVTGQFPGLAEYPAYVDTDHDGMSDDWETFMGLNKEDAADSSAKYKNTSFTNLDVFLQFLVENPDAAIAR